jgi:quaternary ammonium compound-resistance protein SugE
MAWVLLIIAGLAEIAWAIGLKYSRGFTRPIPSLVTVAFMAVSFLLLAWSLRTIPLGTGYAVWTGIGAVGTVIAGIALFDEPPAAPRLFFAAMIVAGMIGLHATHTHTSS